MRASWPRPGSLWLSWPWRLAASRTAFLELRHREADTLLEAILPRDHVGALEVAVREAHGGNLLAGLGFEAALARGVDPVVEGRELNAELFGGLHGAELRRKGDSA